MAAPPTVANKDSTPKPPTKMIGGNLIGVVNEVHDALAQLDIKSQIDLPQIAVVGPQSSGKSSVLESIVGRDFLPRGAGIVTRCPLILKLSQQKAGSPEWGEFSHKPGVKFDDFSKIRQEIEARTAQLATGLGISSTPISLTIFSPNVLNLTLIDLPGIVSNAVGEVQIKNMVLDMIRPENTIILAISPANADLANSVALKAARSVDPQFDRTLGVLTKIDLMDQGTNALDTLEGRLIPLKRGWIGVVNRSQKAINENLGMAEAKQMERDFFANHPDYRHLADRMGTDYLAQTMSTILLGHIQKCLPDLRSRIDELVKKTRAKQEELGMLEDEQDKSSRVFQLIQAYTRDISRAVNGEADAKVDPRVTQEELHGGARLHHAVYDAFAECVMQLPAESAPDRKRLSVVDLTAPLIEQLRDATMRCIDGVRDELRKITAASATRLERFPMFRERIVAIAHQLLEQLCSSCTAYAKIFFEAKITFNPKDVNHQHWVNLMRTEAGNQVVRQEAPNTYQKTVAALINTIECYFGLCKANLCDWAPTLVSRHMIALFMLNLRNDLEQTPAILENDQQTQGRDLVKRYTEAVLRSIEEHKEGFFCKFGDSLAGLKAGPQLTPRKVDRALHNSVGVGSTCFSVNCAFFSLVKEQLARLQVPTIKCIQFIHDELLEIVEDSATAFLGEFPMFCEHVLKITHHVLETQHQACVGHMQTWLAAECRHINTRNRLLGHVARTALAAPSNPHAGPGLANSIPCRTCPSKRQTRSADTNNRRSAVQHFDENSSMLDAALESYFNLVGGLRIPQQMAWAADHEHVDITVKLEKRAFVDRYFLSSKITLCDHVPKMISHLMVLALEEGINAALMKQLFKEQLFDELLAESPQIEMMRNTMQKATQAQEALDKVRDMPLRA